MVVVLGIFAQIVARQFTGRPGFVKRMAEQIVLTNAIVQAGEKYFSGHDHLEEPSIYGLTTAMTRHAGIRSSYNLKRQGFGPANSFVETRRAASRMASRMDDRGGDGARRVSTVDFSALKCSPSTNIST